MVFRTWFSGLEISTLGAGKLFLGHGFRDLGSQLWDLDFHIRGFQDWNPGPESQVLKLRFRDLDGQDHFFNFFFHPKLSSSTNKGFFFSRPKLPSSTNRVFFFFFFFLSTLNYRRRRTGFFFSHSVHPRLSITTCSTLHPSDVGFFTSFNGEDLAMFTSCSIFKTFVPTYLPSRGDGFGVKEKKKRQARADCVRPSRAPTSLIYKITCCCVCACVCASKSWNPGPETQVLKPRSWNSSPETQVLRGQCSNTTTATEEESHGLHGF
jgi:hypothetical protein